MEADAALTCQAVGILGVCLFVLERLISAQRSASLCKQVKWDGIKRSTSRGGAETIK